MRIAKRLPRDDLLLTRIIGHRAGARPRTGKVTFFSRN